MRASLMITAEFGGLDRYFWMVIGVVIVTSIVIAIVSAIWTARENRRRLEENQKHYAERGVPFQAEAAIDDIFHDAQLFQHRRVQIQQLSRATYDGVEAEVYELSYESTISKGNGGTESRTISQTVISLPIGPNDGLHFGIVPLTGWSGRFMRLMGLTTRVESARHATSYDRESVAWFDRTYALTMVDATNRTQIEQLLDASLLHWLKERKHLALEFADSRLFVWIPETVVLPAAREALANDAVALREKLATHKSTDPSSIIVRPPAVLNFQNLALHLVIAGFGSLGIATFAMILCFVVAVAFGLVEHMPLATMIGIMITTLLVWIGAGYLLLKWLTRPPRTEAKMNPHDPSAVGGCLDRKKIAAAADEAARRRIRNT